MASSPKATGLAWLVARLAKQGTIGLAVLTNATQTESALTVLRSMRDALATPIAALVCVIAARADAQLASQKATSAQPSKKRPLRAAMTKTVIPGALKRRVDPLSASPVAKTTCPRKSATRMTSAAPDAARRLGFQAKENAELQTNAITETLLTSDCLFR